MSEEKVIAFINNDVVLAIPVEEAKKYELSGDAKASALSQMSEGDSDVVGQSLFNAAPESATGSLSDSAWKASWDPEAGQIKLNWSPWLD